MIKDSGNRREFETGAVRDIQEGKGRCDLLPLDVVSEIIDNPILRNIAKYQETGDIHYLIFALRLFRAEKSGITPLCFWKCLFTLKKAVRNMANGIGRKVLTAIATLIVVLDIT